MRKNETNKNPAAFAARRQCKNRSSRKMWTGKRRTLSTSWPGFAVAGADMRLVPTLFDALFCLLEGRVRRDSATLPASSIEGPSVFESPAFYRSAGARVINKRGRLTRDECHLSPSRDSLEASPQPLFADVRGETKDVCLGNNRVIRSLCVFILQVKRARTDTDTDAMTATRYAVVSCYISATDSADSAIVFKKEFAVSFQLAGQ